MRKSLCLLVLTLTTCVVAQELQFSPVPGDNAGTLSKQMPSLARQVMAIYKEPDSEKYLDNLFRLQMVAGEYRKALDSIHSLRVLLRRSDPARAAWVNVQFEIYATAKVEERAGHIPFDAAYRAAFRSIFSRLNDRDSNWTILSFAVNLSVPERQLQAGLDRQKSKGSISLTDALQLIHDYQIVDDYRNLIPPTASLIDEENQRRYVVNRDVPVRTPDGATLCTLIVRPRHAPARLPALLEFSIYADPASNFNEARQAASHGYVGVFGLTRGKGCSPDQPSAYVHDGADATSLIDWITRQPWSDGRVGMFGGSYSGFTPWAAAKHMPKGLKAIMVGSPAAPGIDVPMEGNVCWNFVYPWPFYVTDVRGLDNAIYNDGARWNRLNREWYVSGRAYRDLDRIDGKPNPIFDEWISHPSYESYWQSMIPFEKDFGRINIPVLITAGYFYGGPGAAVYYFSHHHKFNPSAQDYLVIGPYDHFIAQRGTTLLLGGDVDTLAGYRLDPAAKLDMVELRYQWFDYVLKGATRPALLGNKVNYQVTGANIWKHAPTLAAMSNQKLRFYLSSEQAGSSHRLSRKSPSPESSVTLTVNLADRTDVDQQTPGGAILDNAIDASNGIEFISDPFKSSTEVSGLFSGVLDFVTNKKDFDFEVDLYEQTPDGHYFQLAPYWSRASYVGDISRRRLLTPGKRTRLEFQSVRLMSRQLAAGSRLVVVLSVIKTPGRPINYGTGKAVNEETIRDAKAPLQIQWFGDSYLDLPVAR